jgi:hypothetical protein
MSIRSRGVSAGKESRNSSRQINRKNQTLNCSKIINSSINQVGI